MQDLDVRPFPVEETEAVIVLRRECGLLRWDGNPRATIEAKLAHSPDLFLVGVRAGVVVATTTVGYDGLRGWLYRVTALPALQGRGIGRAMVSLRRRG